MKALGHIALRLVPLLLVSEAALAEQSEHFVGGEGVMLIPAHDPDNPTAFAQTAFGMRLSYACGLTDDLAVVTRGTSWLHRVAIPGVTRHVASRAEATGTMRARGGEGYRGELGLRYNAYCGYNLAPYLELYGGYQWTTFRDASLQQAAESTTAISDFAEGSVIVSVGAAIEYRLADIVLLGLSVHGTRALSGIYGQDVTVSARVAYLWF